MSLNRMLSVLLPQPGDDLRSWASSLVAQLQMLLQQQANDTTMLASQPAVAPIYQADGNTLVVTGTGEYKLASGTVVIDALGLHVKDAGGFDVISGPTIRIDTQHIVDAAIATAKLAVGAVTNTVIADNSISTPKLQAGSIVAGKLAVNAIVAGDGVIANAAIVDAQVANLNAAKISAGDIAAARMSTNIVTALEGKFATLSALAASLGVVQIQAGGALLTQGVMNYSTGVGLWAGDVGGVYKFRVGNPVGTRLDWDGNALSIYDASNQVVMSAGQVQWNKITGAGKPVDNILDTSTWTVNTHDSVPGFNRSGGKFEQYRLMDALPDGTTGVAWRCFPGLYYNNAYGWDGSLAGGEPAGDADGGWNTDAFPIDKDRGYRFVVWAKRQGGTVGAVYLGCASGSVNDMASGPNNSNPYFVVQALANLVADRWYMLVGFVHPTADWTSAQRSQSGIYDAVTGQKVFAGTDYVWSAGTTTSYHRAYLYYSAPGSHIHFAWPRVDKLTGAEPSLAQLLAMGSVSGRNPITSGNVSTYIANAAIQSAQIGNAQIGTAHIADASILAAKIADAQITTAKIGDAQITAAKIADAQITTAKIADAQITTGKIGVAQVDTLRIAGSAVTVPVGANGTSTATTASTDFGGGAVAVIASGYTPGQPAATSLSIWRDANPIALIEIPVANSSQNGGGALCFVDYPGAGAHYYRVSLSSVNANDKTSIVAIGLKR